jgi:Polyketide cyclase / dehydrase and lipid transport
LALLSYSREATIRRSPEEFFDYLSDLRRELDWNPDATQVEKVTPGPVDRGTRFRAQWSRTPPTEVEVIRHERPRAWATRSKAIGMEVIASGEVTAAPDGSRYAIHLDLRPRGLAWLLAPLAKVLMERTVARNMRLVRQALDHRA